MADASGYRTIFKSTFLFGFVQVFNIAVKVGLNKVVAILLGPVGMGIISLYNTTIQLISVGAGLGINQSAVRDISESRGFDDKDKIDTTISFVKQIIRYTSLLGIIITVALSPFLSEWTFGNKDYTWGYVIVSLAVGATIQTNGYRAINTGMRQLRNVAYSTILGAVAGLICGVPLYFFLGDDGIVPSLVTSSIATLLISKYYAEKIKYQRKNLSIREAFGRSSNMIKMGVSLMLMSFMLSAVQLIISSYISSHGGVKIVGLYQAGATIVTSYFGIIITAMSTDYYPRISSFHNDNVKLNDAVNSQSEVGLLMALPLAVVFIFLAPVFLRFLYSEQFTVATDYLDYAIFGTITIIASNSMGMILLAKQKSKLFLWSSLMSNFIILIVNIIAYNLLGLKGLGMAYMINGIMQFSLNDLIMWHFYKIRFSGTTVLLLFSVFICIGLSIYFRSIAFLLIKRILAGLLFFMVSTYSIYRLNKIMDLDLTHRIIALIRKW
ncbi:MAG: oligosaccharide flippase family protein [Muribaculaceae bacterium]|nr:oligosaccharide flippase family protein [Muribaculaceae bacterium]